MAVSLLPWCDDHFAPIRDTIKSTVAATALETLENALSNYIPELDSRNTDAKSVDSPFKIHITSSLENEKNVW